MITRVWILTLALSILGGASLTAGVAHADVGSRCNGLANDWSKALGPKGDKREIPRLRARIEQKSSSCPTLWRRASTYRSPTSESALHIQPPKSDRAPGAPEVKLEACLVDIVRRATAIAGDAYAVEKAGRAAAKEGEARANAERTAHPTKPSIPPWTYPDGVSISYWGDTIADTTANGYGVMEYSDGRRASGVFKNGAPNGPGIFKSNTIQIISNFREAQNIGPGVVDYGDTRHAKITDAASTSNYVVVTFTDGSTYKGQIPNKDGESAAVMYDKAGNIVNAGIYRYYTRYVHKITKTDCSE